MQPECENKMIRSYEMFNKRRMMVLIDNIAGEIAQCTEHQRGEWLSYLLESIESETGEDVLREIAELLRMRSDLRDHMEVVPVCAGCIQEKPLVSDGMCAECLAEIEGAIQETGG